MDQLKVYMAQLRKHYFWVLCGILVIVSLGTWTKASADLRKQFNENLSKIKGTYGSLETLGEGTPNPKFTEGLGSEREKLKSQVLKAWEFFGKEQFEKLQWPGPVADIAKLGPKEEIPEPLRAKFGNEVIKAELLRLMEKANIRRPKGNADAAGKNVEFEGIVAWDQGQRDELRKRYELMAVPSTVQVRVFQEDLWVFESIVETILNLNHDATDSLNAVIKRVEKLEIAQWATADAQENPGAKLVEKEEDMSQMTQLDKTIVTLPVAGAMGAEADKGLLDGRYLDEKCSPVAYEAAKDRPPFAEFKQMFVTMRFVMDQRRLPDLLAACANSPLPIEARQVLMHFRDSDSILPENEAAMLQPQDGANRSEHSPYDATVEIRGIVYVYNDPEDSKLGTGSAATPAQRSQGIPQPTVVDPAAGLVQPTEGM
jgi:hypothetical protein